MQISSVSQSSIQPTGGSENANKMRQLFQKLGSALESGNQADAKEALAQIQKNAPPQASQDSNNPMATKMAALSKAVESGDMTAAKTAFADIKEAMSQRPQAPAGGARAGGGGKPSGPPPGGGGAKSASGASSSSSSNTTYDVKDTNKDGTVSAAEELQYALQHPDAAKSTDASASGSSVGSKVDLFA